MDATELARSQESLQAHLHRQALGLRLSRGRPGGAALPDRVAQRRRLPRRPAGRPGARAGRPRPRRRSTNWCTASRWRCACCRAWSPPVWARATWASACRCSSRPCTPRACRGATKSALRAGAENLRCSRWTCWRGATSSGCRRCAASPMPRCAQAIALIGRLEPKPGRRFVDVERNIVVPDVLVTKVGRGAQQRFRVRAQPRRDAAPAGARHLRQRTARSTRAARRSQFAAAAAAAGSALVHQEHPAAL